MAEQILEGIGLEAMLCWGEQAEIAQAIRIAQKSQKRCAYDLGPNGDAPLAELDAAHVRCGSDLKTFPEFHHLQHASAGQSLRLCTDGRLQHCPCQRRVRLRRESRPFSQINRNDHPPAPLCSFSLFAALVSNITFG